MRLVTLHFFSLIFVSVFVWLQKCTQQPGVQINSSNVHTRVCTHSPSSSPIAAAVGPIHLYYSSNTLERRGSERTHAHVHVKIYTLLFVLSVFSACACRPSVAYAACEMVGGWQHLYQVELLDEQYSDFRLYSVVMWIYWATPVTRCLAETKMALFSSCWIQYLCREMSVNSWAVFRRMFSKWERC